MKGVILAAGRGSRLGDLTTDSPKCLAEVSGRPLLAYQQQAMREGGCTQVGAVVGYKGHKIQDRMDFYFHNEHWATSNMVTSLECASEILSVEGALVSYSDIIYSAETVAQLLQVTSKEDFAMTYDPQWLSLWQARFEDPLSDAESFRMTPDGYLAEIGRQAVSAEAIEGQYMGLLWFSARGWSLVQQSRLSMPSHKRDEQSMTALLDDLVHVHGARIRCVAKVGPWCEVDSERDVLVAEAIMEG